MKLDEIFGQGHRVAYTAGPMRHVVKAAKDGTDEGLWVISEDAMETVAYRKKVAVEDLAGTLSDDDKASGDWNVDDSFCWCDECSSSRKMLETQCD
jgi:hypothetical protein